MRLRLYLAPIDDAPAVEVEIEATDAPLVDDIFEHDRRWFLVVDVPTETQVVARQVKRWRPEPIMIELLGYAEPSTREERALDHRRVALGGTSNQQVLASRPLPSGWRGEELSFDDCKTGILNSWRIRRGVVVMMSGTFPYGNRTHEGDRFELGLTGDIWPDLFA